MSRISQENWYKEFFSKYYLQFFRYKKSPLKTKREVKFICRVLNLPKRSNILDLACGPGRHAIELAKKGFNVTCLDLNKEFLELAENLVKQNKISLRTVQNDMRTIPYKNEFDAVINIFSSFGYFKNEEEDLKVIKAVSGALKPNGIFLLDLANKNWVLAEVVKKNWQKVNKTYVLEERSFDKRKNIYLNKITLILPDKTIKHTSTFLRLYTLAQIKRALKNTGLNVLKTYGDYNGEKFHLTSSPRLIILAKKS